MRAKSLLLLLLAAPLWGSPESLAIQELRSTLQEMNYLIHSQRSDLLLLEERIADLERDHKQVKQLPAPPSHREADLVSDIQLLKNHLEKMQAGLKGCEKRLNELDRQWDQDIGSLKNSLQSMLSLLKGDAKSYVVKAGDSLGQIALNHKTSSKVLKELNHLNSDVIYPGQKLILP